MGLSNVKFHFLLSRTLPLYLLTLFPHLVLFLTVT